MSSYSDAALGSIALADSPQFAKEVEFECTPEEIGSLVQHGEKTTGGHIVAFQSFVDGLFCARPSGNGKFFASSADKDGNGFIIASEEFEDLLIALIPSGYLIRLHWAQFHLKTSSRLPIKRRMEKSATRNVTIGFGNLLNATSLLETRNKIKKGSQNCTSGRN